MRIVRPIRIIRVVRSRPRRKLGWRRRDRRCSRCNYAGNTLAFKSARILCEGHHGVDRAPDVLLYLKPPRTLRTAGLRALAFTLVSMLDHRLGDAPSELLA